MFCLQTEYCILTGDPADFHSGYVVLPTPEGEIRILAGFSDDVVLPSGPPPSGTFWKKEFGLVACPLEDEE